MEKVENLNMINNIKRKPKVNKFVKGAVATLLASGMAISTAYAIADAKTDNYSSQNQIEKIADALDCDTNVMKLYDYNGKDDVIRLKHNDGEPIYVNFQEGYPEKLENMAKSSLDYVFNIVGGVNDFYQEYEVVDNKTSQKLKKQGKNVIEYTLNDTDKNKQLGIGQISGYMDSESDIGGFSHFLTDKPVIESPEICINSEVFEKRKENLAIRSYTHELLHVFGFGDVYTDKFNKITDKHYGNTFMYTNNEFELIMPNDYACIMSAYAKPMESKAELNSYIKKCQTQLESYKDYFYQELEEYVEQERLKTPHGKESNRESIDGQFESIFKNYMHDDEGNYYRDNLNVVCDGDSYTITVTDENGNILDSASGKVRAINGAYILENAEFKCSSQPISGLKYEGGYVTDYVLIKADKKDFLFDISEDKFDIGEEKVNTLNNDQYSQK